MKNFDVFMSPYGGGGSTGGGGTGGTGGTGSSENLALNLTNFTNDGGFNFVDSPHKFTDPPRYYKANDPYYFEVDNMPLKQIHENCLWLKDQITGIDTEVSGYSLNRVTDLQPFVTDSDRVVSVRPGKFTARINDAYSTTPDSFWANFTSHQTVDISRSPIYLNPSVNISDATFAALVSDNVNQLLYNNGLYDHYQHHASIINVEPPVGPAVVPQGPIALNFIFTPTYLSQAVLSISQIPKIKTAVWKQTTDTNVPPGAPYTPDLQQLSVDFCRRWKGVFRTSVVNSTSTLSINIPEFDEDDYIDSNTNEGFDPQVRIDLLFMYAHPVDATESHIAVANGESPEKITQPRLGLVKGAGSILAPASLNGPEALDIVTSPALLGTGDWSNQVNNNDKYYETIQRGLDSASLSIQSPLSDQLLDNTPFGAGLTTGASFPSPDDLLNLAPILSQDAIDSGFETVGQSVLPICYIIVKKGEPLVLSTDIIDIRPFLRTAELTYNERAGVAAANPPLSLANPAIGKYELYNALEAVRDFVSTYAEMVTGNLDASVQASFVIPKPMFTTCLGDPTVHLRGTTLGVITRPTPLQGVATTINNDITTYPEALSNYGTASAITADANGVFTLIPGVYDVDWSCCLIHAFGDAKIDFSTHIVDILGVAFPGTDTWSQRIDNIGPGNESANGSDQPGASARMRGFITITQDMFQNGENKLQFSLKKLGGNNGYVKQGGVVTITRMQNNDGTEGTIK